MSSPNRRIRQTLRRADAALISRHPGLARDDAMALGLFGVAFAVYGACALAWSVGVLPTVVTVLGIALAISTLHELEHDLIHDLYLESPWIRTPVLLAIWVAKCNLDPWKRGRLHRWHHIVSGQAEDVEERLIGLGMRWGLPRLLVTLLPMASAFVLPDIKRALDRRSADGARPPDLDAPEGGWLRPLINVLFLAMPLIVLVLWAWSVSWVWPLLVLWVLPNLIRHGAIVFMSSNSHYVECQRGELIEQNQILDHPIFWPLQILCWNFGATHVLHHFWVRQPFWRRTLIFAQVRDVLVEEGVRRNDFQTFTHANRRSAA